MKPSKQRATRKDIIACLSKQGRGNTASNLGMVEIFQVLTKKAEKDRVFLNEQLLPGWLAALYNSKKITKDQFLNNENTMKNAMCCRLGEAISLASGSALAAKLDDKKHHTYCIIGDGEHDQGQIWEAILFASKHKLSNLTVIVNRNNIQSDGYTENIMPIEPLKTKYEAFNWHAIEADGHNTKHIQQAIDEAKRSSKPSVIIAHTTPGKGVHFMENQSKWRKALTKTQAEIAHAALYNA